MEGSDVGRSEPNAASLVRPRVVVGGEALIDLIIDRAGGVTPAAGGGQYNTARAIARLGGDAHFLGRISDDWFGRLLRSRQRLEAGILASCHSGRSRRSSRDVGRGSR